MCTFIVTTIVFLLVLKSISVVHVVENYGPYEILFSTTATCHGPKPKDLTAASCGTKHNNTIFSLSIKLPEEQKIETMKLTLYGVKDGLKKDIATYRAKNPCTHYLLGPLLKYALNTTGSDSCIIKPGVYASEFDATSYLKNIYSAVIYGDYISKVVAYNRKGNLVCFVSEVNIVPAK